MVLRNHLCETFGFTPKNSIRMPFLGSRHWFNCCFKSTVGERQPTWKCKTFGKKHKIFALEQLQNAEKISIWVHFVIVQQSLNNSLSLNTKKIGKHISVCRFWSGRRDSNSRRSPWQGDALPLSHSRIFDCWCLRAESNHRHGDFQSPALPTELQRQIGDPDEARTHDLQRDRLAF